MHEALSTTTVHLHQGEQERTTCHVGAVSFLNTLPMIDGLDRLRGMRLTTSVPSLLIDGILSGTYDVALCSSVDYFVARELCPILPVGQLGCDGPTMTVRLYSAQPPEAIERVWCDVDSHTSVALLRIVLKARTGRSVEVHPFHARERMSGGRPMEWPPAMLLIGDKVVTDSPPAIRYPYQLDLGAAWKEMTGLPFVFGLWLVRPGRTGRDVSRVAMVLDRQRRRGMTEIDSIVARHAAARGWPIDLATTYLRDHIRYEVTSESFAAIERFGAELVSAGVISSARPIVCAEM